ncbi:MAG: hypothetical protein ACOX0Y_04810 [Thiopseudomonas sp.]
MKINSFHKCVFLLIQYCLLVFLIAFVVQFFTGVFHFFKFGVFTFGVHEIKRSFVAGITVGLITGLGVLILSMLNGRAES